MDAKLHAVDADTGQPCADFGTGRRPRLQRLQHHRRQLAALAAAAADRLRRHALRRLGRQGLGRGGRLPGLGLRARRPHRRGEMDLRHPAARAAGRRPAPPTSGPRCRSIPSGTCSTSRSPRRARTSTRAPSRSTCPSSPRSPRSTPTPARWSGAASSSTTTSGTRHQRRPDAGRHREGRPEHPGAGPDLEAGLPLRARPRRPASRSIPIEERPVPPTDVPGETSVADPALCRLPRAASSPTAGPASSSSPTSPRALATARAGREGLRYEGSFTPPSLQGSLVYPGTIGGIEWGGGAVDPTLGIFVVNYSSVGADLQADPARRLRRSGRAGRRDRRLLAETGAPYGIQLTHLPQPARHALLEAALRHDGRLRPEDRRAALERALRAGAAAGASTCPRPGGRSPSAGRSSPRAASSSSAPRWIAASAPSISRPAKCCGRALVDAPAVALPAVYAYKGRQYVVFVAGGNSILTPRSATRWSPSPCLERRFEKASRKGNPRRLKRWGAHPRSGCGSRGGRCNARFGLVAAAAITGFLSAFLADPATAQQVTGTPGSPEATTTLGDAPLPPPDPKFGGVRSRERLESHPVVWPARSARRRARLTSC